METREKFRVRITADGQIAISSPQMRAFGKYECHICNDWPAAIPTSVTLRTVCLIGSKSAAYVSTYLWSSCELSVPVAYARSSSVGGEPVTEAFV